MLYLEAKSRILRRLASQNDDHPKETLWNNFFICRQQ